jgi:hypothetical protein
MAHRGPAAKTVKHGRTPNADWTEVVDTPYTGPSPELPKLSHRRRWNEMVVQWWEQVRTMPHCVLWRNTDWMFAIETALQKHDYYADDDRKTTAATEIRRREAQLGTTAEARRQLRIRYVPAAEVVDEVDDDDLPVEVVEQEEAATGGATVTPLADRRRRLTQRPA